MLPRAAPVKLTHTTAVFVMVAVTLMWSIAGVVTRHLEHARSFEVTFWRSLFTVLSLAVILPFWKGRRVFGQIRTGGRTLWISGVCWSVMFTAFMVALTLTTTANVLVTLATGPLLAALAARLFIGHRLPARTWAAIAVAGAGIAWMYGAQIGDDGALAGTLVALCVPIAGACHWTNVQQAHASGADVDLLPAVLIGAAVSATCTLPLAWPFTASGRDLALLGFLGVFQLAIPCMLSMMAAAFSASLANRTVRSITISAVRRASSVSKACSRPRRRAIRSTSIGGSQSIPLAGGTAAVSRGRQRSSMTYLHLLFCAAHQSVICDNPTRGGRGDFVFQVMTPLRHGL